jgi:hypothetical protein
MRPEILIAIASLCGQPTTYTLHLYWPTIMKMLQHVKVLHKCALKKNLKIRNFRLTLTKEVILQLV